MKILLQAGHEARTSGATGAPNEQSFNIDIANKVADELRSRGVEVKRIKADPTDAEIAGDWDLALSIHYDADIYGTGGGFVDYADPAVDDATVESQRIAYLLRQEYFGTTGIVNHPERSNKNTRFYPLWERLSSKTPCVIIECGVGMHVPDDHQILHFNRPLVVEGITKGICLAFNIPYITPSPIDTTDYKALYEAVIKESQTKLLEMAHKYETDKTILTTQISTLETALKNLQDTEHTWEDAADDYQRKLKAIIDLFATVNIQLAVESDVSVLVGTLHDYIANAEADRTFVTRILSDTSLGSPEAVLEVLERLRLAETTIVELEKVITKLRKDITSLKIKQPTLRQFIINKYFIK